MCPVSCHNFVLTFSITKTIILPTITKCLELPKHIHKIIYNALIA